MTRFGYFLSSEEYSPADLVEQARLAEASWRRCSHLRSTSSMIRFYGAEVLPRVWSQPQPPA